MTPEQTTLAQTSFADLHPSPKPQQQRYFMIDWSVGYAVKPADYGTVETTLIDTLEKGLGEAFTPPVSDAWIACSTTIVPEIRAVE